MNLTLTGYSTALFSTWYFIEELGILFDAGDGATSGLLQKAGKITNVFISHADRDHLTGLLQLNQLNARPGFPIIHYPEDCGSFPPLEAFSKQFDLHVQGTVWKPVRQNDVVQVKDAISVLAVRNEHVVSAPSVSKSLGFKVIQSRTKLKSEIAALPQERIRELMAEQGKEKLTTILETNLITYSGDTPVDDYERWNHSEILIHEATFLGGEQDRKINPHGNKHSSLDEVLKMVSEITVGKLILGHFSSRYTAEQIDENIRRLCREYQVRLPVYRVLPGQIHRNILSEEPVNS